MVYTLSFKGKNFTNQFKNQFYNFVKARITNNFEFDGKVLTFKGEDYDLKEIYKYMNKQAIETTILKIDNN